MFEKLTFYNFNVFWSNQIGNWPHPFLWDELLKKVLKDVAVEHINQPNFQILEIILNDQKLRPTYVKSEEPNETRYFYLNSIRKTDTQKTVLQYVECYYGTYVSKYWQNWPSGVTNLRVTTPNKYAMQYVDGQFDVNNLLHEEVKLHTIVSISPNFTKPTMHQIVVRLNKNRKSSIGGIPYYGYASYLLERPNQLNKLYAFLDLLYRFDYEENGQINKNNHIEQYKRLIWEGEDNKEFTNGLDAVGHEFSPMSRRWFNQKPINKPYYRFKHWYAVFALTDTDWQRSIDFIINKTRETASYPLNPNNPRSSSKINELMARYRGERLIEHNQALTIFPVIEEINQHLVAPFLNYPGITIGDLIDYLPKNRFIGVFKICPFGYLQDDLNGWDKMPVITGKPFYGSRSFYENRTDGWVDNPIPFNRTEHQKAGYYIPNLFYFDTERRKKGHLHCLNYKYGTKINITRYLLALKQKLRAMGLFANPIEAYLSRYCKAWINNQPIDLVTIYLAEKMYVIFNPLPRFVFESPLWPPGSISIPCSSPIQWYNDEFMAQRYATNPSYFFEQEKIQTEKNLSIFNSVSDGISGALKGAASGSPWQAAANVAGSVIQTISGVITAGVQSNLALKGLQAKRDSQGRMTGMNITDQSELGTYFLNDGETGIRVQRLTPESKAFVSQFFYFNGYYQPYQINDWKSWFASEYLRNVEPLMLSMQSIVAITTHWKEHIKFPHVVEWLTNMLYEGVRVWKTIPQIDT